MSVVEALTEPMGPLPRWAWIALGGGAIALVIVLRGQGSTPPQAVLVAPTGSGGGSGGGSSSGGSGGGGGSTGGGTLDPTTPDAPDPLPLPTLPPVQVPGATPDNPYGIFSPPIAQPNTPGLMPIIDFTNLRLPIAQGGAANGNVSLTPQPVPRAAQPVQPLIPSSGSTSGPSTYVPPSLPARPTPTPTPTPAPAPAPEVPAGTGASGPLSNWANLTSWSQIAEYVGGTRLLLGDGVSRLDPGADSGWGFKLPVAYRGTHDTWRGEFNGTRTEGTASRVIRYTADSLHNSPGQTVAQAFNDSLARVGAQIIDSGANLYEGGFDFGPVLPLINQKLASGQF